VLGAWWHLLHWFALSCFALSAGYAGLGPRVFGKRPDGRLPLWSRILHLPYMLYSECVWQLVRLFNGENPTDAVSAELVVGRRLRPGELPTGVVNYVDLTAETEDPASIRTSTNYINLPILDASVPSSDALHAAVAQLKPGPTFAHCAQGHGRTGLFALALLAERGRIGSFEEGMAQLKSVRPGLALNKAQETFARQYIAERPPEQEQ
jgi:protein-tyrosine phosphatase